MDLEAGHEIMADLKPMAETVFHKTKGVERLG